MSSGENMLPSPSTRHNTNGLSSYIGDGEVSVDAVYYVVDATSVIERTIRALLLLSSSCVRFSASFFNANSDL